MEDPRRSDLWLMVAGINGVLAIAAASWAAHGAGTSFQMDSAARLHIYHALALFGVAAMMRVRGGRFIRLAGWAFMTGIVLFCGLIYLHVLVDWYPAPLLVPTGGVAFMIGWGCLAFAGFNSWRWRRFGRR